MSGEGLGFWLLVGLLVLAALCGAVAVFAAIVVAVMTW